MTFMASLQSSLLCSWLLVVQRSSFDQIQFLGYTSMYSQFVVRICIMLLTGLPLEPVKRFLLVNYAKLADPPLVWNSLIVRQRGGTKCMLGTTVHPHTVRFA